MYFSGDDCTEPSLTLENVHIKWSRIGEFKERIFPFVESNEIELYIRFNEQANIYQFTLTNRMNQDILNFELCLRHNGYFQHVFLLYFKTATEHQMDKRLDIDDILERIAHFSK